MGRVNIEIEAELHKKLKVACAIKETTIEKYINKILKETLKSQGLLGPKNSKRIFRELKKNVK